MKVRVFLPMAAACLIGLGTLSLVGVQVHAQSSPVPASSHAAPGVSLADAEDHDRSPGVDTDNVQEQVGDQNGPDVGGGADVD